MRAWVTYLLGLTLVALAMFGAYHAYSMNTARTDCAAATPASGSGNFRHAPLRA